MNIKTHRSCLLCFSFLGLLVCAAYAQEPGEGAGDRLSKLRTAEQNMEQMSAKLQDDIRDVESMDDANLPRHVVIMAGQHLLEGYALMTREKYEGRIAAMVRLGEMTPQQAQQHKRDILAKTRTFPQEARRILTQIGQKLALTKRELRALSAGSGEVANTTGSPGNPASGSSPAANTGGVENRRTNEARWGPINNQASLLGKTLTFHSVTTVQQCQADCDKNPQCVAFSVFRAEFNADNKPSCFLMSEVTGISPSTCCISAIKSGSEPEGEPEIEPESTPKTVLKRCLLSTSTRTLREAEDLYTNTQIDVKGERR